MTFQETFARVAASPFAQTLLSFATAFVLGTAIGFERQWRQRNAGLRTTVLVALGAAAFADLGMRLLGVEGATRIIAYIVSGIGFLGAGVILKDGPNIRGLNTAATLWCSAAVGAIAGSRMPGEAAALAFFVLAGNTMLRPLVNWINRRPISAEATEAEYRIHATCDPGHVADVRDLLDDALDAASLPIRSVEILSDTEEQVELAAILVPTSAEEAELDQVVSVMNARPWCARRRGRWRRRLKREGRDQANALPFAAELFFLGTARFKPLANKGLVRVDVAIVAAASRAGSRQLPAVAPVLMSHDQIAGGVRDRERRPGLEMTKHGQGKLRVARQKILGRDDLHIGVFVLKQRDQDFAPIGAICIQFPNELSAGFGCSLLNGLDAKEDTAMK